MAAIRQRLTQAWARTTQPRVAQWLYWAGWCLPPLVARVLMNIAREISPGVADLRGIGSDLFCAMVWALFGLLLLRVHNGRVVRGVLALFALVWALASYGNFEHVFANDAPLDVVLFKYLGDDTFMQGSSAPVRHPIVMWMMLLGAPLAVFRGGGFLLPEQRTLLRTLVASAGLLAFVQLWSPSLAELGWRQSNFLELAPDRLFSSRRASAGSEIESPRVRAFFENQLGGQRRVPLPERPTNVLVIMVEGMTGAYVPALAEAQGMDYPLEMPLISERAKASGLYFTSFINHQRQTNRGEYTVLCGELPKLSSETAKMSEYIVDDSRECLPRRLQQEGYYTSYLQAAALTFMMKDQFMERAGFDEVKGKETFTKGYASSGWGVDDKALFEGILETVVGYEKKGKPWFAAALNVGTHHPFPVPASFPAKPGEAAKDRAFRYVDEALVELLDGLEREGLADHTLVLVTSDESQGIKGSDYGDVTQILSKNWGVMMAFGPGLKGEAVDGFYSQSDLSLSVLDYLGLASPDDHFTGRSYFRKQDEPRDAAFANAFTQRQYFLSHDGKLVACPEVGDTCEGYRVDPARPFGLEPTPRELEAGEVDRLRAIVEHSELTAGSEKRDPRESSTLALVDDNARGIPLEGRGRRTTAIAGQAVRVSPGQTYRVSLTYRLEGKGARAEVYPDLRTRNEKMQFQPMHDPLEEGDRVRLEYVYRPRETAFEADVRLLAYQLSSVPDAQLVVEEAVAVLSGIDPDAPPPTKEELAKLPEFEIVEFSRAKAGEPLVPIAFHRVTEASSRLHFDACIERDEAGLHASGCKRKGLVRGPGDFVPAKSRVRVRLVVHGVEGEAQGRVRVQAAGKKKKRKKGKGKAKTWGRASKFDIRPGERTAVELTAKAPKEHGDVGVSVDLPVTEGLVFDIESIEFEVLPPRKTVTTPKAVR